jgi:hypothetical protein
MAGNFKELQEKMDPARRSENQGVCAKSRNAWKLASRLGKSTIAEAILDSDFWIPPSHFIPMTDFTPRTRHHSR